MSLIAVRLAHRQLNHRMFHFLKRCSALGNVEPRKHASIRQHLSAVRRRCSFENSASARFAHGEGQIYGPQERLVLEDHAALDRVLQLANIAWPVVSENQTTR